MSLALYWWRGKPNFGDQLSPIIVSFISENEVNFSQSPEKLLAVGSILGFAAREHDIVWGSGMLWPARLPQTLRVTAVRGPNTRDVLLRQGIECPAVYGDPAWLMPRIYRPRIEKRYQTAVLPHHSDVELRRLGLNGDVQLLSVADGPLKVIDGILAAERLVTSSLHGLIIAETYGIPVVLRRDRGQTWEKHFKFTDYYASTRREDQTLWDVSIEEAVRRIPDMAPPEPIDSERLIAAFPSDFRRQGDSQHSS